MTGKREEREGLDHEKGVVNSFFRPARRARYLGLLASDRGRRKLRLQLAHLADLDTAKAISIATEAQTPERILQLLHQLGAPEVCYVISEIAHLDGRTLPLDAVLRDAVGHGSGTIVSCIPGQLAYYEGEDAGTRYILRQAPPSGR